MCYKHMDKSNLTYSACQKSMLLVFSAVSSQCICIDYMMMKDS